jgi:hypothetical protein
VRPTDERKVAAALQSCATWVESLSAATPYFIGASDPPNAPGVYVFILNDLAIYVGEAKGSGGLRDRILGKHVAGDERHALQRYFMKDSPDRLSRREYIKQNVKVRWIVVADEFVPIVERLAIWLFSPRLNRK